MISDAAESDAIRRAWLSVAIMTIGAFTVVVNVTMLSPLLRPIAEEFGISEAEAGRLGTLAAVIGALAAILCAPIMDRVSIRSWVLWQVLFLTIISAGSALAPTFAWLLAARAFSGTSMMLAKCLSSCAEIFNDSRRRNRAIGVVVSATTAGTVIGLPVIALVEDAAGWRWAYASLLLPLGLLLAGHRLLSDQISEASKGPFKGFTAGYRTVFSHLPATLLVFSQGIMGLGYFGWLTYLGAYVEIDFGGTGKVLSLIFIVAGVGELLANNLVPIALRRWSPARIFMIGGIGFTIGLAASGFGSNAIWIVFLTTTLISAFSAAQYVVISILLLDSIPHARGAVMSLANAAMGIGGAIGVAIAGFALGDSNNYSGAFRSLAIAIPLAVVAVSIASRRIAGTQRVPVEPAVALDQVGL